jgi:hypothetical protein
MCIELIRDKNPLCQGIGSNCIFYMFNEIIFLAGIPYTWGNNISRCNFKVGNQTLCSMANIICFPALNLAFLYRGD